MTERIPRVSIGMPVYNGERFIREALDSILAQSFTDFELIISDNASTDRTEQICRAYAARDDRIRYFRNEKNLGVAANCNRVFKLSSGDYFKWAAHDDMLGVNYLQRCVEAMDRSTSIVLCIPRMRYIDDRGAPMGDHAVPSIVDEPRPSARFRRTITMADPCFGIMVWGMMRSTALRQTRLYGRYFWWTHILLAELSLLGEFVEISDPLHFGRLHDGQSFRIASWRDRAIFMSPAYKPRFWLLTRWGLIFERFVSIRRSNLNFSEKVRCYAHMLLFTGSRLRLYMVLWFWRMWARVSRYALLASRFTHMPLRSWALGRSLRSGGWLKLGYAIRSAGAMSDEDLFFTMARTVLAGNGSAVQEMLASWLSDPIPGRRLAAASALGARLNGDSDRSEPRPAIESERRAYALMLGERLRAETSERVLRTIVDSLAAYGNAEDRAMLDEVLAARIDLPCGVSRDLRKRVGSPRDHSVGESSVRSTP